MESVKIRKFMVPLSEYVTVGEGDTLSDVFQKMADSKKEDHAHAHRDALVLSDSGKFLGKVTMMDVFMALEPNYSKIGQSSDHMILTTDYVQKLFRDFNLWEEPLGDICRRGASITVADIMHTPDKEEYVSVDDSLDFALHKYIMGIHQPLLVLENEEVVGVLRLGDLFEEIRTRIMSCEI